MVMVTLVMILKNEAAGIAQTLESVKPYVDRWVIGDTGSTDGTQGLVIRTMKDTPGFLYDLEFKDFSQARNSVLERAGTQTEFTLMLSGDETLEGGDALRNFCQEHFHAQDGAYDIRTRLGTSIYDSARLARAPAGWRYVGVTHELLQKDGAAPPRMRVPGVTILHGWAGPEAARKRWETDRTLLAAQAAAHPEDTRAAFYLAQTLECLGEFQEAHAAYERRIALGGWWEEVFEAKFRRARTAGLLGEPWAIVQQQYLEAHSYAPHRAEPLYAIAEHYNKEKDWPLTLLFARAGMELPFPSRDRLFVDEEVYTWKLANLVGVAAYWVGEFETGIRAVRRALKHCPNDERLEKNLSFYLAQGVH